MCPVGLLKHWQYLEEKENQDMKYVLAILGLNIY